MKDSDHAKASEQQSAQNLIYHGRPALSGKVTGTPKIRFQILVPNPKRHPVKAFGTAACTSLAAKGNEDPDVGLEREAIPHYSRNIGEHNFATSKATEHDVVGDETENNSANPQTLVVENQHINPPEEQKLMANADYDEPKKLVGVFYFKPLPKATQCEKKEKAKKTKKKKKVSSSILTSTPIKEMLEQKEKQKEEQKHLENREEKLVKLKRD
ncbi:uncharacterized protein TNCV_1689561 [Trichonephila clavipes]|nr:uncharacterized protein TNCV_1689561 [Trichonephila clavipes]